MRSLVVVSLAGFVLVARLAAAQDDGPIRTAIAKAFSADAAGPAGPTYDDAQSPAPRKVAFEYSEGYKTRAKIHRYASFATLPLFATELALGQSIYDHPSEGKKGAHVAVGTSIVGLYGVQAVTGVWNLMDAKKDPHRSKTRIVHSILMLASGAGFAITPMVAPGERERFESGGGSRSTHRAVALTSIGLGTAGYLVMLIGGAK